MPLDLRPYGGYHRNNGRAGQPGSPVGWQHQPGDHSDTGILPLLTPITGTGGVAFGFSVSGTGAETFTGSGGVSFGFALAGTGTVTSAGPGVCAFDPSAFDDAAFYICGDAAVEDWYPGPLLTSAQTDDDDGELLLMVATLRSRLRL